MQGELRASFPLPPPHYTQCTPHTPVPPPPPPSLDAAVYATPVHETYASQFAALEASELLADVPRSPDARVELRQVTASLLLTVIRLVAALRLAAPLSDLETLLLALQRLFVRAHHALNAHRPHQARAVLLALLKEQRDRRRVFLEALDNRLRSARAAIEEARQQHVSMAAGETQ